MSGWGTTLVGHASTVSLLESLRFEFGDGGTIHVVGPTVRYSVFHELGTSKMKARPFAKPAAERVQANLDGAIDRFLDVPLVDADEDAMARAAALAVQREMQRIITQKDIIDTGTMRSSVSIQKVS